MNIAVFEDSGVRNLYPITLSRPAYSINCGSYRLLERLMEWEAPMVGLVRPHLERIQLQDYPQFGLELDDAHTHTLLVNARTAPTIDNVGTLNQLYQQRWTNQSMTTVVRDGWAIAAAVVPTSRLKQTPANQWLATIESLESESSGATIKLFQYPHDVIATHMDVMETNLAYRIAADQRGQPRFTEIKPDVFVGRNVRLSEHVVFDTDHGPVMIDDRSSVGPFSFFRGPVYVGPNSKISEHASIKDCVAISHTCKIGGEVEGAILEPFSNKQHHGFLGHSYLGSWVNLGAGTCNSDLKNTYGTVNMEYHGEKVSTGLQFVGCVIGDYAKTAINTSIFTGKTIGVGSMVYGFATTNVPSFVNYARTFNEQGCLPPEVIVTTQKRMFARRNVPQRPCDIQLIHDMFQLTAEERSENLSIEPLAL